MSPNKATIAVNLDTPDGIEVLGIEVILFPTNDVTDNMYNVQRAAEQLISQAFMQLHRKKQQCQRPTTVP